MNAQPTIHNIQILRGIAAMMVVFHHTIGQMGSRGGRDLGFEIIIGRAGVDLFFVISGFIMVYVTHDRDRTPIEYWRGRIIRIAPLYWFYTLTLALIALVAPSMLRSTDLQLVHFLKSLFFIPSQHPIFETKLYPILVQGWTLNYEMYFYLIFGLLLAIKTPRQRIGMLSIILVGLVAIGFLFPPKGSNLVEPLWQTYTSPLLLEFLFGALIGVAYIHWYHQVRQVSRVCIILGLGLFALGVWQPDWTELRVIKWGLPSAFLVTGALGLETNQSGNGILMMLGNASYSTYLNHTFTLGVIGIIWARFGNGSLLFDAGMFSFALAASAAIGILSYKLIERPMTAWLGR